MAYLEELLPEFRKGAKIRLKHWDKGEYIYFKDKDIFYYDGKAMVLDGAQINSDAWELYKEPEPDWDSIIENKCLCWFRDSTYDNYKLSFLAETYIDGGETRRFLDAEDTEWLRCIPVRRDEVIFYDDRKDK